MPKASVALLTGISNGVNSVRDNPSRGSDDCLRQSISKGAEHIKGCPEKSFEEIREKVKNFPLSGGIYTMKNSAGEIIYIGKASSLRKRVRSYFRKAVFSPHKALLVKDGKSFPLVEISREVFPRIRIVRKKSRLCRYFGPYPQAKELKQALELIRRIIPFRSCARMPKKECLYFHLNLSSMPIIFIYIPHKFHLNLNHI